MAERVTERLASLAPAQLQELADQLAAKNGEWRERSEQVESRPARPAAIPLSFSQESVWYAERLGVAGSVYCLSFPIEFEGVLDTSMLECALEEVVRRHEALRTRFVTAPDGAGQQIVDDLSGFVLDLVDLTDIDEVWRERELQRRLRDAGEIEFDIANGPLYRAELIRVSEHRHVLCWSVHHLVWDGLSVTIFVRELLAIYAVLSAGEPSPLPPVWTQYADFAVHQRTDERQLKKNERRLQYWRSRLDGQSPMELPADKPRSRTHVPCNDRMPICLPKSLVGELRALCKAEGSTLYTLLLAALQILLSRWVGVSDVTVGSPFAGRSRQTHGTIGFFSSMLPIRVDIDADATFAELLTRVRGASMEAFANPAENLYEELRSAKSDASIPPLQVAFALHGLGSGPIEMDRLRITVLPSQYATIGPELSIHLVQGGNDVSGWAEYDADLYERDTIERFADRYRVLLEQIAANPRQVVGALTVLGDTERQRVIEGFNDTAREFPRDRCVHRLFEQQAVAAPDSIAITHDGVESTYDQLNRRANRLARYMIRAGVVPGDCVGVCAERGTGMIVAMLAVLKAGAAYVPLDPASPPQRLEYMIQDSAAKLVIGRSDFLDELEDTEVRIVSPDRDRDDIARQDDTNFHVEPVDAERIAYVMYTSGSTGEPKGVLVPHRAISRLVIGNDYLDIDSNDVVAFCSNPAFDAATFEVWAALLNGARLVPVSDRTLLDVSALAEQLTRERVSILHLTTALFNQCRHELASVFVGLKCLYFGGEAADPNAVRDVLADSPPRRLIHLYGPTETTSFATWHEIGSLDQDASYVPIGRPLGNARIYILDDRMEPMPIGSFGEIYVAGDGVAAGYLDRPKLTAERFVTDPFARKSSAKMYRTGDLGRWRSDGTIQFGGRIDQQVKIRGHRIELGEIEAQLGRHPAVEDSVVVAREYSPGEKRLVAYVKPKHEGARDARASEMDKCGDPMSPGTRSHLEEWQAVYEAAHAEDDSRQGPSFAGWKSSFSGTDIPAEQMREWRDQTVSQILAYRPQRVLEIGCGTGLLLEAIAPDRATYLATDFSSTIVRNLRAWVATRENLRHVEILECDALDVDPQWGSFDTVVLNSVAQYFPDLDYLIAVLRRAANAVADGGRIFVGDVRNLRLLQAFHSAVQLARADDSLDVAELRRRIEKALQNEKELVIDPEFFNAVRAEIPRISHVEIRAKRGRHDNELTRYRYDVVLYLGTCEVSEPDRWTTICGAVPELRTKLSRLLGKRRTAGVRVRSVANSRLAADIDLVGLLKDIDDKVAASELKQRLEATVAPAESLENLCRLAESRGFRATAYWDANSFDGSLCCEFVRPERARPVVYEPIADVAGEIDCSALAYEPARSRRKSTDELVRELNRHLGKALPVYMLPSSIVCLDELPLTPNGKIDMRRLPAPDARAGIEGAFVPPQGELEHQLAEIWNDVLSIDRVGRHDRFAELGGNSILAIRVAARANRIGLALEGRQVLEHDTLASLARVTRSHANGRVGGEESGFAAGPVPLTPLMRQLVAMTDESFLARHILVFRLACRERLDPQALHAAVRHLIAHHDALRIRLDHAGGDGPRLVNDAADADDGYCFEYLDLSELGATKQDVCIDETALRLRSPECESDARMLRIVLVERGADEPQLLLAAVHHIVFDPITQAILFGDLQDAYRQACSSDDIALAQKTSAFKDWADGIVALECALPDKEVSYWRSRLTEANMGLSAQPDGGGFCGFETQLDNESTRALKGLVAKRSGVTVEHALLAALLAALARQTGRERFGIYVMRSGRDVAMSGIDVSRTVGWFSSEYPVVLRPASARSSAAKALADVAEQLQAVPAQGIGYSVLRFGQSGDQLGDCARPLIGLNYTGETSIAAGGMFDLVSLDLNEFPKTDCAHEIARAQVVARIGDDGLRMTWACDASLLGESAMKELAANTMQAIHALIDNEWGVL